MVKNITKTVYLAHIAVVYLQLYKCHYKIPSVNVNTTANSAHKIQHQH